MVPMTNHFSGSMLGSLTARLADIDPDLTQSLSDEEREHAQRLSLRVLEVGEEELHLAALLAHERAAGLIVVEGMVRHHLRIGERLAIRLLGAGEILACGDRPGSMLLSLSQWYTTGGTRLAVLGEEFLLAIRRWPRLYTAMQQRMAAQSERLAAQLVICQLPRVEDRLLAILWLLAESWGRVTPAGTTVPLALTHEALGALVGARRSTVTLALGELTSRGAIVHQDRGWLLLERPVELSGGIADRGAAAAGRWPVRMGPSRGRAARIFGGRAARHGSGAADAPSKRDRRGARAPRPCGTKPPGVAGAEEAHRAAAVSHAAAALGQEAASAAGAAAAASSISMITPDTAPSLLPRSGRQVTRHSNFLPRRLVAGSTSCSRLESPDRHARNGALSFSTGSPKSSAWRWRSSTSSGVSPHSSRAWPFQICTCWRRSSTVTAVPIVVRMVSRNRLSSLSSVVRCRSSSFMVSSSSLLECSSSFIVSSSSLVDWSSSLVVSSSSLVDWSSSLVVSSSSTVDWSSS